MKSRTQLLITTIVAAFTLPAASIAGEVKLPSTLAWSAYNTGTTGYNQSVAIGKALKHKYSTSLRVVPGKNDISRLTPLARPCADRGKSDDPPCAGLANPRSDPRRRTAHSGPGRWFDSVLKRSTGVG